MYSTSTFLHNFSSGPSPSSLQLVGGWGGQREQVTRGWEHPRGCGVGVAVTLWAHGEEDPALPTHPGMSWVQESLFVPSSQGRWIHVWLPTAQKLLLSKWGLGAVREGIAHMSCLLNKQYLSPGLNCFKPLDWNAAGNRVNAHCRAHLRNPFCLFHIEGFSLCHG